MKSVILVLVCVVAVVAAATAMAGGGGHKGRHKSRYGDVKSGNRDKGEYLQKVFEKLDADGNGSVTRQEFPGPERKFDRIDADGNGEISLEELKQVGAQRHKARAKGRHGKRVKKKQNPTK